MSLIGSIYGRVGQEPVGRTTKSGSPMTTTTVAVNVTGRDADEPETMWVGVLAFGVAAEELLRASKGQMVAAMGKLTRGIYTPAGGEPRESWSMLCDSVVVTKAAKPTGGARPVRTPAKPRSRNSNTWDGEPAPFDDPIGF